MPNYELDTRFLDIDDLSVNPLADNAPCGLVLEPEGFGAGIETCGAFGDNKAWMVPQLQWRDKAEQMEQMLRDATQHIHSQMAVPQCVADCTTATVERAMYLAGGVANYVKLSAKFTYSFIALPGGRRGAMMRDGANFARDVGSIPLDTPENQAIYSVTFGERGYDPRGARALNYKSTAAKFKVEYFTCHSFDEKICATFNGFGLITGRSQHSIPYIFFRWSRGQWHAGYQNSWGQWGDVLNDKVGRGLGWDSERTVRNVTCYAVRAMRVRDEQIVDIPDPRALA